MNKTYIVSTSAEIDQIQEEVPLENCKEFINNRSFGKNKFIRCFVKNYDYQCFDPDGSLFETYQNKVNSFISKLQECEAIFK